MAKDELKKETADEQPQDSIFTSHSSSYHVFFNGKTYEFKCPMVSLDELITCLEFVREKAYEQIEKSKIDS